MFVSSDRGENWSQLRNLRGLTGVHLRTVVGVSGQEKVLLGATSRQLFRSADGGIEWKPVALKVTVTVPPQAPKVHSSGNRRAASGSAGANRGRKPLTVVREISPADISGLYTAKNGGRELILMATNLGLYETADLGERWSAVELSGSPSVFAIYTSPYVEGRIITRTSLGLYDSKDGGEHWDKLSFPLSPGDVNEVAISADPSARLLVATRVGLYSSTDGGQNWYAGAQGIGASTVSSVVYGAQGNRGYAVEYGQLYQTSDGGKSWALVPTALPSLQIGNFGQPRMPLTACTQSHPEWEFCSATNEWAEGDQVIQSPLATTWRRKMQSRLAMAARKLILSLALGVCAYAQAQDKTQSQSAPGSSMVLLPDTVELSAFGGISLFSPVDRGLVLG